MKRLVLGLAAAIAVTTSAFAEFEDGQIAFTRGEYATAFEEWFPLAREGDAVAQNRIGSLYLRGRGVAQDFVEAGNWFRAAADQGDADSQFELGLIHKRGIGVESDPAAAFDWFQAAARQGNGRAQYQLGLLYKEGVGVAEDLNSGAHVVQPIGRQHHRTRIRGREDRT